MKIKDELKKRIMELMTFEGGEKVFDKKVSELHVYTRELADSDIDRRIINTLEDITARFSPNNEDRKLWRGFTTKEQIFEEAKKVLEKLNTIK